MARIKVDFMQEFSKDMSPEGTYPLTLEYFCFEKDEIWNNSNDEIIDFALIFELKSIFDKKFNVIHLEVSRKC